MQHQDKHDRINELAEQAFLASNTYDDGEHNIAILHGYWMAALIYKCDPETLTMITAWEDKHKDRRDELMQEGIANGSIR